MLVSKAEFYFQLHILSIKWKQMNPKNQQFLIRNPFQLLSFSPHFPFSGPHNYFPTTKKVLILNVKAEIHTGKIHPYIKNQIYFPRTTSYFMYTYGICTFRHIPWTRYLKKGKKKWCSSHFWPPLKSSFLHTGGWKPSTYCICYLWYT